MGISIFCSNWAALGTFVATQDAFCEFFPEFLRKPIAKYGIFISLLSAWKWPKYCRAIQNNKKSEILFSLPTRQDKIPCLFGFCKHFLAAQLEPKSNQAPFWGEDRRWEPPYEFWGIVNAGTFFPKRNCVIWPAESFIETTWRPKHFVTTRKEKNFVQFLRGIEN